MCSNAIEQLLQLAFHGFERLVAAAAAILVSNAVLNRSWFDVVDQLPIIIIIIASARKPVMRRVREGVAEFP